MAKFFDVNLSQTSGELSPLLAARSDLSAYNNGAREMTNCLAIPQGGFINRPGTRRIASGATNSRLIPFIVNTRVAFVLCLDNNGMIRVFQGDTNINNVIHNVSRVDTNVHPYRGDVLREITYIQSVDKMWIFHNNHAIRTITRFSNIHWEMSTIQMEYGPFQEFNTDQTYGVWLLWQYYRDPVTGDVISIVPYIGAHRPWFTPDLVGSVIKIEWWYPAGSFDSLLGTGFDDLPGPLGAGIMPLDETGPTGDDGNSSNVINRRPTLNRPGIGGGGQPDPPNLHYLYMFGEINIQSHDSFVGEISLWRRGPFDRLFERVSHFSSSGTSSGTFPVWGYSAVESEFGAVYRLEFPAGARVRGQWSGGIVVYRLRMTQFVSPSRMMYVPAERCYVLDRYNIASETTGAGNGVTTWALESWGSHNDRNTGRMRGWPGVAAFHQERMIVGNSLAEPTTIWMSRPADWHNFGTTFPALDDDAIEVTLASKQANFITAFSSREDLLVFTEGAEFVASSGSRNDIFTPSTVVIVPAGFRGSFRGLDTLDIGHTSLFVQRHGNVVRGIGFRLDQDGYDTNELSILSEHLFEGVQVRAWAYQQEPWSLIWIALSDGSVLSFTFNQEHQITAWSRHIFNNFVSDLCVIPGQRQENLYMIVGDGLVIMNERIDRPGLWIPSTYQDEGNPIHMTFESLDLEQVQASGTVQGRHKQVPRLTMRLFRTCGLRAGVITENSELIDTIRFPGDTAPAYRSTPFTGDIYMDVPGGFGKICRLRIQHNVAAPLTVLGIYKEVLIHDDA